MERKVEKTSVECKAAFRLEKGKAHERKVILNIPNAFPVQHQAIKVLLSLPMIYNVQYEYNWHNNFKMNACQIYFYSCESYPEYLIGLVSICQGLSFRSLILTHSYNSKYTNHILTNLIIFYEKGVDIILCFI